MVTHFLIWSWIVLDVLGQGCQKWYSSSFVHWNSHDLEILKLFQIPLEFSYVKDLRITCRGTEYVVSNLLDLFGKVYLYCLGTKSIRCNLPSYKIPLEENPPSKNKTKSLFLLFLTISIAIDRFWKSLWTIADIYLLIYY